MRHRPAPRRATLTLTLALSLALSLLAGLVVAAAPAGAGGGPANDAWAGRYPIPGTTGTATGENGFSSLSSGEQKPSCCSSAGFTNWWSWTATFTGPALFTTAGSSFDTTLGVWTGSTFGALTERGSNDDGGSGRTSWVEISVVQGTEYQLQVGGYNGATGGIRINVNPISFPDVGRTHPFWRDVEWISSEGLASGYSDGGYHPSASISRAAMSAFLYRLVGEPVVPPGPPTFTDVGAGHPFFAEIEWMNDTRITTGYTDHTYRPAAPVTRGAMAAFIYRFDDSTPYDPPGSPTFDDVSLTHPFFPEIEWMNDKGITTGYLDHTYRPSAPVTRAAMAAFLHRYAVPSAAPA
jgi:hypothetical protein